MNEKRDDSFLMSFNSTVSKNDTTVMRKFARNMKLGLRKISAVLVDLQIYSYVIKLQIVFHILNER